MRTGQHLSSRSTAPGAALMVWAAAWTILIGLLFVGVTALTIAVWASDPDAAETTPVSDLAFFTLGAIICAGFASQLSRRAPVAGGIQALTASLILAAAGALGHRIEPFTGGLVLSAASMVLAALHLQRRRPRPQASAWSRSLAAMAVLAGVAGLAYAERLLDLALGAGPSCFLGRCAEGDRLAEMAAAALVVPALTTIAAWQVEGWRLPLWSAGSAAIIMGTASCALPAAPGSFGLVGGVSVVAWGAALVTIGERRRHRASITHRP